FDPALVVLVAVQGVYAVGEFHGQLLTGIRSLEELNVELASGGVGQDLRHPLYGALPAGERVELLVAQRVLGGTVRVDGDNHACHLSTPLPYTRTILSAVCSQVGLKASSGSSGLTIRINSCRTLSGFSSFMSSVVQRIVTSSAC